MAALNLPEYYADLAQTTLSSSYTAASGSMVVTSAAALSTTRQFHFMITDQSTGAVKVIGKATAVSTNTFTITATTDNNANSGDFVTIVVCAGAEDQIRFDQSQFGAFSALPSVAKAGDVYKQTDGPYEFRYTGSVWQAFWNGWPVTLPPTASWTNENLSSNNALVHYTNGFGYMVGQSSSNTDFLSMTYRAAPSTPYTITIRFIQDGSGVIQSVNAGGSPSTSQAGGFAVGFRDSSGKYLVLMFDSTSSGNFLILTKWNSVTSISGNNFSIGGNSQLMGIYSRDVIIQITNDGTNLIFKLGIDQNNMIILDSHTITNFLADAASVTWGMYGHTNSAAVSLMDWTQS